MYMWVFICLDVENNLDEHINCFLGVKQLPTHLKTISPMKNMFPVHIKSVVAFCLKREA